MFSRKVLLTMSVLSLLTACGGGGGDTPDPVDPPSGGGPDPAPKYFTNVTESSGLSFTNGFSTSFQEEDLADSIPNGVAVGDYDNDGDMDLFIVRGDIGPNLLYRNDGNLQFTDVASIAGVAYTKSTDENYRHASPAFADLDGDTDLDLIIPGLGGDPTLIYSNNGDGSFSDVTSGSGLDTMQAVYNMSPALGDYDLDGDLDLFIAHWGTLRNFSNVGDTEHLWRNDSSNGQIKFTSVSVEAGISPSINVNEDPNVSAQSADFVLSPTFARINNDSYPDILVTADFNYSQVFINNKDGTFTNTTDYDVIIDGNGMGTAVGDYDGDGDLDWFVTSINKVNSQLASVSELGNRLYQNDNGVFTDVTDQVGVAEGGWAWGACFIDVDNDGDLDIYHTNGWTDFEIEGEFTADTSRLFLADGTGGFVDVSLASGVDDTEQGRGVVCADFDNDGDIDILQMHRNEDNAVSLYRNDLEDNNYLAIDLLGKTPNTAGVGARIIATINGTERMREVILGSNFASHNPTTQIIGLGTEQEVERLVVEWPDGTETEQFNVVANQRISISHPDSDGIRLQVSYGAGAGYYQEGDIINLIAQSTFNEHYHFSHWTVDGEGTFADPNASTTTFTMPGSSVSVTAHFLPGPVNSASLSVARRWNEVLLQAIRKDYARPTVHARNLFHISAAMYDSWTAYQNTAVPWLLGRERAGEMCSNSFEDLSPTDEERRQAISFASYRIIQHRFADSPGASQIRRDINSLMSALGYDPDQTSIDYSDGSAPALGNHIADCYIRFGLADNANEANDYANRHYQPVNEALQPELPGNPNITDLNRWQPLSLLEFIDQSGNLSESQPEFLSPEWGQVYPFSLTTDDLTVHNREGNEYWVYHDPGQPPLIQSEPEIYKWAFSMVSIWSAHLDPTDGVELDISPASLGNISTFPMSFDEHPDFYNTLDGGDASVGYSINPVTGLAYEQQLVPRGDYARVLAEFWADGPDSETPPGHWFVILNTVHDHELFERKFEGNGPELGQLEWDVKAYFALGGAMHDSAISAWGIKGWYDYIRPISSIRAMADLGQSSDPDGTSYHPDGIPLTPGYVEVVESGDPLAGNENEHLGKIKLFAWKGPDYIENPLTDVAGVDWILAENWWPYQRPSFVTPPFAGYVSGHSTYSRAAAELLTALSGSAYFPGGMSGFEIEKDNFLVFERGPSVDMTLQWATYRDASDQCSLSRIWGGIHPSLDDIPGRLIGEKIGVAAFAKARSYFDGTATH